MSALSGYKRRLKLESVYLAQKVQVEKVKIAQRVVLERAQKDAEFAADVLKAVGEHLPLEIKEACVTTLKATANENAQKLADKWAASGLLDPSYINTGSEAVIVESQAKQPIESYPKSCDEECHCHGGGPRLEDCEHFVQMDGGGLGIVHETELPDYPKDGVVLSDYKVPENLKSGLKYE